MKDSGQHLDRRGFSGAVGSKECYFLAFLHGEPYGCDRLEFLVFRAKYRFEPIEKSWLLDFEPEYFPEVFDLYACGMHVHDDGINVIS